jgi:hypothetical protein
MTEAMITICHSFFAYSHVLDGQDAHLVIIILYTGKTSLKENRQSNKQQGIVLGPL